MTAPAPRPAFRAMPADLVNLTTIADALRVHGGPAVTHTAIVRHALATLAGSITAQRAAERVE